MEEDPATSSALDTVDAPLTENMLEGMLADTFPDWPIYAALLDEHVERDNLREILDVGGGSGMISDYLLEYVPRARVTLVDSSSHALDLNTPHERKNLVQASAMDLNASLPGRRFDLVVVNDLLHHLVGATRQDTRERVVRCMSDLRELLSEEGRILIYEITYEGWWPGVEPGDLIYALTSIRTPWLANPLRRLGANTAGIGVAFRSRAGWRSVFEDARLQIEGERVGYVGRTVWSRFLALGIHRMGAHVFLLKGD